MTGFVITDLAGAPRATGVVRCAKKVLQDGARTMARSQTYAWAIRSEQISGASAGISVDPAARDEGIAAFVDAVRPRVESGELSLDAAKGVGADELTALAAVDARSALRLAPREAGTLSDELLAEGALAAAAAAIGDLAGRTVVLEGATSATPALVRAIAARGARLLSISTAKGSVTQPDGLDPDAVAAAWAEHGEAAPAALGAPEAPAGALQVEADVLLCGSKLGLVDHLVAQTLGQRLVVPIAPAPITAKGLAVAGRRDITVLPDFVTATGALAADHPDAAASAEQVLAAATEWIGTTIGELIDHPEGPLLGACYRAEEFLATWQEQLPFGRPLA